MKRLLPLAYALGAMLLFAILVRLTFFIGYELLGLSLDGHGALSTTKTLINMGFDVVLVLVTLLMFYWGKVPGLDELGILGLKFDRTSHKITMVCLAILVIQYGAVVLVTAAMGTKWTWGDLSVFSLIRAIILMLAVGIGEEFYFRGGIFNILRPYGRLAAYLISCLIFAQAHFFGEPFHILRLVGTFLPGLLFIYTYEQSGSIWPGSLVHAAMNLFSLLVIHQVSGVSLLAYTGNETVVMSLWNISYLLTLFALAIAVKIAVKRRQPHTKIASGT